MADIQKRPSLIATLLLLTQAMAGCSGMGPGDPNASIDSDSELVNVGSVVNFDARASTSPDPTIIDDYTWDFGDGTIRTTKQGLISHIFEEPGTYSVMVTVTNDEGGSDSAETSIFVNALPEVKLEIPDFVRTGEIANLDASKSTDFENGLLSFSWDFDSNSDADGDGDPRNDEYQTGPIAEVSFNSSGNHSGAVTVTDDNGGSKVVVWTLRVVERSFMIVWEQTYVNYQWSGYLEQGASREISQIPGEGARIIDVSATLTLDRELLPIQWPEDNFTLFVAVPTSGWSTSIVTSQENITENSTASIERSAMNSIPQSGYTVYAESKQELEASLLNDPDNRFGMGEWRWTVTATECDPDFPIDQIDPDEGNGWQLEVQFLVAILRISEVGV